MGRFLHCQCCRGNPHCHRRCPNILAALVLADRTPHRFFDCRLRISDDYAFLPLPSILGSMVSFPFSLNAWNVLTLLQDLCLRTIIHRHRERPTVLLRHVLPLQRCRPTIRPTQRLLALLDVLAEPIDVLDRRSFSRYPQRHGGSMYASRSCLFQSAAWPDLFQLRLIFRRRSNRISHEP